MIDRELFFDIFVLFLTFSFSDLYFDVSCFLALLLTFNFERCETIFCSISVVCNYLIVIYDELDELVFAVAGT